MPKVFISHSWDDNDISRKIAHDLKRDGAEIWIDYARISGGESLPERISEALEWCDTLVLVWSKSAATSKWVKKEWTSAIYLDKTIIPCLLDDTKLPAILSSLLYINFENVDAGYNELCRTLRLTTFEERQKAEAEKLKLEQERLEAERQEKEKQRKIQAEQEKERQQKLQAEQERQKKEQQRSHSFKSNIAIFRSEPTSLSSDQMKAMLKRNDFFDSYDNKTANGFDNQFETQIINGKTVVIDHASGLMWQQSGSANSITYENAKEYIQELNRQKFAGFNDWRLPTLEEAMSLMEPKKLNDNLYIDPKFDANQWWIWTADQVSGESRAWVVYFRFGTCSWDGLNYDVYVRAVRSGQSSTE